MSTSVKRPSLALYSDSRDHYSHRIRFIIAEKAVSVDVIDVDPKAIPAELSRANPYQSLPTLLDRGLMVYETRAMMEYLDERFPHPPMLPVYPVARAEIRQFIHRVEVDWCPWVDSIVRNRSRDAAQAKMKLRDSLMAIAPIFADKPFFMSAELTLLDCCVAPILWRLPLLDIEIPSIPQTAPLLEYQQRLFSRESFLASLTHWERSIRTGVAS